MVQRDCLPTYQQLDHTFLAPICVASRKDMMSAKPGQNTRGVDCTDRSPFQGIALGQIKHAKTMQLIVR
jgi:hypothetical protein